MILPSTRQFLDEAKRLKDFSVFDLMHGYAYGRWPYFYIGVATGEHWLSRWLASAATRIIERWGGKSEESANRSAKEFANGYHGKVVPLDEAVRLVSVQQDVTIGDLEQVIPYTRARDIVLKNPDHIVVMECPCRASREHPCLPMDVCLIIGEPFAGFILEHQPDRARRITQAEAMEILRQEDERGHVHHAFFKDAMLGRFYAICNCCDCCCGAMRAHRNGTPMLASSGYVARVDADICVGCEDCQPFCQFKAMSLVDGKSRIDEERCMGCGVCISHCEYHALSFHRDPAKGIPLEIRELMHAAIHTSAS